MLGLGGTAGDEVVIGSIYKGTAADRCVRVFIRACEHACERVFVRRRGRGESVGMSKRRPRPNTGTMQKDKDRKGGRG